jgi:signal transduction histidine kinase
VAADRRNVVTGDERFADLVRLACHDLRTPLATVSGFAKTLVRAGELGERDARFAGMIDEAAGQMTGLIAKLSLGAALASGRYERALAEADTLELTSSADERVSSQGRGEAIETDPELVRGALTGLAAAALRHGQVPAVTWRVDGRDLVLEPVEPAAAPVLDGSAPKDLGALVGRLAIESLGGSVTVQGRALRVRL